MVMPEQDGSKAEYVDMGHTSSLYSRMNRKDSEGTRSSLSELVEVHRGSRALSGFRGHLDSCQRHPSFPGDRPTLVLHHGFEVRMLHDRNELKPA